MYVVQVGLKFVNFLPMPSLPGTLFVYVSAVCAHMLVETTWALFLRYCLLKKIYLFSYVSVFLSAWVCTTLVEKHPEVRRGQSYGQS